MSSAVEDKVRRTSISLFLISRNVSTYECVVVRFYVMPVMYGIFLPFGPVDWRLHQIKHQKQANFISLMETVPNRMEKRPLHLFLLVFNFCYGAASVGSSMS